MIQEPQYSDIYIFTPLLYYVSPFDLPLILATVMVDWFQALFHNLLMCANWQVLIHRSTLECPCCAAEGISQESFSTLEVNSRYCPWEL